MKSVLCERPESLVLVDREKPTAGPGEALVRIRRVGVCGTDLHIFQGKHPYLEYPRVIGHELAGEIAATHEGSAFKVGQPVCVIPYLSCGRCIACRRGKTNCCQTIRVLGVHCDGGMTEFVAVPETNLLAADGISMDAAAMVEFLSIGAHGIRRSGLAKGDRVLVVGAGPVGIAAMIFAKLRGAQVTALDIRADRLSFCIETIGIHSTVMVGSNALAEMAEITDGDMFDVVIDATGNAKAIEQGFEKVAHGGTFVLISVVKDTISFSDPEFHKRETTLVGSRNATREDFVTVLDAMRAGKIPLLALNTHKGALADVPELLADWLRPESGVIKALVEV